MKKSKKIKRRLKKKLANKVQWCKDLLGKIQWVKGADWTAERIIRVCSFPIWFPIVCYKYGLVYSDNLKKKFIGDD